MSSDELIAEIDSSEFPKDEAVLVLLGRGLRDALLERYKDDADFCEHIAELDDARKSLADYLDAREKAGE